MAKVSVIYPVIKGEVILKDQKGSIEMFYKPHDPQSGRPSFRASIKAAQLESEYDPPRFSGETLELDKLTDYCVGVLETAIGTDDAEAYRLMISHTIERMSGRICIMPAFLVRPQVVAAGVKTPTAVTEPGFMMHNGIGIATAVPRAKSSDQILVEESGGKYSV